jgi:sporulation protein YlmC with PRC-barrel domain
MFAKYMTTALIGSALLATAAMAQTQTPSTSTAPPKTPAATTAPADTSHQGQWRASKMVGLKIYNSSNESLGSVNDMLMDEQGSIKAVVIGVGGFLGVGEHYVAVPFDKIKWVKEPVPSTSANAGGGAGSMSKTTTTGAAPTAQPAAKANPWYPDHGVFDTTKDELKKMPEFKYST